MCGFIGIHGPAGSSAVLAMYEALVAVQHRGQDAAGMVTFSDRFHVKRGIGLVRDVFRPKNIARLRGPLGIGHVRYPTVGAGSGDDVQPFLIPFPVGVAMAHNGNVTNFLELKRDYFGARGVHLHSDCDLEAILYVFAQEFAAATPGTPIPERVFAGAKGVFERVRGSYSVVGLLAGEGLFAFRDPYGIKPLLLGERVDGAERSYAFASESVALDVIDFHPVHDLGNGEVVFVDREKRVHARRVVDRPHRPCIFEYVYFARPDSRLDGVSVYRARLAFGEALAREWIARGAPKPDVVVPVPDSARDAASALARGLGVPYREALVKNRYIGRTFIMPDQDLRKDSVRRKLNPIPEELAGRKVLLVDDSIVRGNTARKLVSILRGAGAREVYFAICCPPLVSPCVYGIDMATKTEFIARDRSVEEVRAELGADYLLYLPHDAMTEAVRRDNPRIDRFCSACFTGEYPTGDVSAEMLAAIEKERVDARREIQRRRNGPRVPKPART
jgi:amidophosphoribosyltransferase